MPYAITDFSHTPMTYPPDRGGTFNVSMRTVYNSSSQLAAATAGAPLFSSKHARRRYVYASAAATGKNALTRHYPVAIANAQTPVAPQPFDGVTWTLKGYRGEQDRA